MTTHDTTTLVLGSTGETGRRVVERLRARGQPVRVGSRRGAPPFDWENPATWGPALDGVSAVYIAFHPDLAVPGAPEAVRALADAALERDAREPFVDADDIADVAVAALTEPGHVGETYELTSPRLYTLSDVAAELSHATGRTIRYTPVSVAEYARRTAAAGAWQLEAVS